MAHTGVHYQHNCGYPIVIARSRAVPFGNIPSVHFDAELATRSHQPRQLPAASGTDRRLFWKIGTLAGARASFFRWIQTCHKLSIHRSSEATIGCLSPIAAPGLHSSPTIFLTVNNRATYLSAVRESEMRAPSPNRFTCGTGVRIRRHCGRRQFNSVASNGGEPRTPRIRSKTLHC
jgi:hypothetical protein